MGRKKINSKKCGIKIPPTFNTKPASEINGTEESSIEKRPMNPIPITSRIIYPLVRRVEKSLSPDSDEEDTIEFDFRPRNVFISNACSVCTELCKPGVLCERCKSVSYCTEKHKRQDSGRHKDLCTVLNKICTNDKTVSSLTKNANPEQYRIFRVERINLIEEYLGRRLDLWEREIVLYPRVCLKCHNFDKTLHCCPNCSIVFYCQDHEGDHFNWCLQYRVFHRIISMQYRHGKVDPDIPNIVCKEPFLLPNNFDVLMSVMYNESVYFRKMDVHTYTSLSHIATIPLTTLHTFQKSSDDWGTVDSYVIHIVGAELQFEGSNLHVWEKLFLHFLPNLRNLTIVITGPELFIPDVPEGLLGKIKMCSKCKKSNRRINLSFVPGKLYHEFSKSSGFSKPDLVCLFNPGLYRTTGFNGRDTWPQTISEFCATEAHVVVTAYTEHEIPRDIERIKSICDVDVVLEPQRNPYASLKPDRNFVSDDTVPLIYKNYFISIIKQVG